jgi:hypothetical protein
MRKIISPSLEVISGTGKPPYIIYEHGVLVLVEILSYQRQIQSAIVDICINIEAEPNAPAIEV